MNVLPATLSPTDAALYLGVSLCEFLRLSTTCTFPSARSIGDRVHFLREELDAWLASRSPVDLAGESERKG